MKLIISYLKIFFWWSAFGALVGLYYVTLFKPEEPMVEAFKCAGAIFTVVMLNGIITSPLYWLAFRE